MATNKYLSIITLNVSILNAPIKRNKITEWIKEHDPHILFIRDPTQNKRPTQTENKGLEKNIPCKQKEKTAGVLKFISDKIDFKTKAIERNLEGHLIILNGGI